MADLSSFDSFKDWMLGVLFAAVCGLAGLVRKLDVGEITRRLEDLERRMAAAEKRSP